MFGPYDDLFDFDHDGKMDGLEVAAEMDYMKRLQSDSDESKDKRNDADMLFCFVGHSAQRILFPRSRPALRRYSAENGDACGTSFGSGRTFRLLEGAECPTRAGES